jgi:hypothetical protein
MSEQLKTASADAFGAPNCAEVRGGNAGSARLDANLRTNPIGTSYGDYACKINAIGIDELFRRYEQAGFLYPAKMARLAPFMDIVKANWRKAVRGGELILWIATFDDPPNGAWGTMSSWRSTDRGWITQHLVSTGGPVASRAVMLAGQAVRIRDGFDTSHQNWFRPKNRFANKVFGSIVQTLGEGNGWVGHYAYLAMPLRQTDSAAVEVRVYRATLNDLEEIKAFAREARSEVYMRAEGLDGEDLELDAVQHLYQRVGLQRFRRVFVARQEGAGAIIGIALVYRGPLGLNFSFLENRCDVITKCGLEPQRAGAVYGSLIAACASMYENFEPRAIPLVVDAYDVGILESLGAELIRDYSQSIWLDSGYERWYRHVERFYDRIIRAEHRRGLATPSTEQGALPCVSLRSLGGGGQVKTPKLNLTIFLDPP